MSLSRIIPGLPFSLICIYFQSYKLALLCVAFFTFTDWLDGYLARRFGIITDFGEAIDPIADKVFYLGTLLALGLPEGFSFLTTPLFVLEGTLLGVGLRGLQRALLLKKVNPVRNLRGVFRSMHKLPEAVAYTTEQRGIISNGINFKKKLIKIGANRWGKNKVCFEITLIVTLIFERMGLWFPGYWFLLLLTGATVCAALSIGKRILQKMS